MLEDFLLSLKIHSFSIQDTEEISPVKLFVCVVACTDTCPAWWGAGGFSWFGGIYCQLRGFLLTWSHWPVPDHDCIEGWAAKKKNQHLKLLWTLAFIVSFARKTEILLVWKFSHFENHFHLQTSGKTVISKCFIDRYFFLKKIKHQILKYFVSAV